MRHVIGDNNANNSLDVGDATIIQRLLTGLDQMPEIKVWGINALDRMEERVATVSITHERFTAAEMAEQLGHAGFFTWHGNYYALNLTESLGLEPDGMLRVGLLHYNTLTEVERLLEALHGLR